MHVFINRAFSATALTEAAWALDGNPLTDLSEQQMVDCIEGGCGGGFPSTAIDWIKQVGQMNEAIYPYRGQKGQCAVDSNKATAHVAGPIASTTSRNEED